MVLIRRLEEKAASLRAGGLIPGFLHPCIGQEAVAVGVCSVLRADDVLTSIPGPDRIADDVRKLVG